MIGDCYGDGNVYRGERCSDSQVQTVLCVDSGAETKAARFACDRAVAEADAQESASADGTATATCTHECRGKTIWKGDREGYRWYWYRRHAAKNWRVSARCVRWAGRQLILAILHFIHGLIPVRFTSHEYLERKIDRLLHPNNYCKCGKPWNSH